MMEFQKIENRMIDETLYVSKHPTGVEVFVLPKRGYRRADAMFVTKYGSIHSEFEVAGSGKVIKIPDGTAHFLEHKMFEEPDGNVFDKFSVLGANANAFTSFAITSYLFSATENFKESLSVLLKFVQAPYFTPENIAKEQGIIGQEIRMYDDHPQVRVLYNLLECLYHNCPVKKNIAGTQQSIAQINERVLFDVYNTFYHPSNMFLFVAGGIEPEQVASCVEDSLRRDIEPLSGEIKSIFKDEPASIVSDYAEQKLSVSIPLFMMGFKDTDIDVEGIGLLKKSIETKILLEMLLGKGSELYALLYKEGLINDTFGTDYTCHRRYAFSTIEGESKDPKKVRQLVLEHICKAKLSEEDFRRVRNVIWGKYIRCLNSTSEIAYEFVSWYANEVNYLDFYKAYVEIGFSDIEQRFKKHFTEDNLALSVVLPLDK